jgi:phosphoserine aminotransferase
VRKWNFGAGPGALPEEVLEQVRDGVLEWRGQGLGMLELGHRTSHYEQLHHGAAARVLRLLEVDPAEWTCLLLPGGATLQFAQVPLNLGRQGAYAVTGTWAKKAFEEARRLGPAHLAASSEATRFDRLPTALDVPPGASYLHLTTNNTVYGTQWASLPECAAPLVLDASSDVASRPLDLSRVGLLYAGAQKNLGAAGVAVVALRNELLERVPADVPHMLSYKAHAQAGGIYNTPPVFAVWVLDLVTRWVEDRGGVAHFARVNERKAARLYACLDAHPLFRPHARPADRSRMNVTFRLARPELEPELLAEAEAEGLLGLAGHRSVGGFRVSLYNAVPEAAVEALVGFLEAFARRQT